MTALRASALLRASQHASFPAAKRPRVDAARTVCIPCLLAGTPLPREPQGLCRAPRRLYSSEAPMRSDGDKPNGAGNGAARPNKDSEPSTDPEPLSNTSTASELLKEPVRTRGFGTARFRASRARAEELPPLNLPDWFRDNYVALHRQKRVVRIPKLEEAERDSLHQLLLKAHRREGLSLLEEADMEVISLGQEKVGTTPTLVHDLIARVDRAIHFSNIIAMYVVALWTPPEARDRPEWHRFEALHSWLTEDDKRYPRLLALDTLQTLASEGGGGARSWLAGVDVFYRPPSGPPGWVGGPLALRQGTQEWVACNELYTRLRTELEARSPDGRTSRNLDRPVTLLSVLNYKGRIPARDTVYDIAAELRADIVFLDASSLARILGGYLGQTPYWSRGPISMLGYGAAEINGAQVPRSAKADQDVEFLTLDPSSRTPGFGNKRELIISSGSSDERWEDLKLAQALEKLVAAADERAVARGESINERLIIHLHDYLEINTLSEEIVSKLRTIIDRMWRKGRKVVLVGSTSSDITKNSQWQSQLADLARDDCHVVALEAQYIPIPARDMKDMESYENFRQNMTNIRTMMHAISSPDRPIDYVEEYYYNYDPMGRRRMVNWKTIGMRKVFFEEVFDAHLVYRYASLALGSTPGLRGDDAFKDITSAEHAVLTMLHDRSWKKDYSDDQGNYFVPTAPASILSKLSTPLANLEGRENRDEREENISVDDPRSGSVKGNASEGTNVIATRISVTPNEKALLSGLIRAKDITTTFDDIVVPEATKNSLKALTTLPLERPDAFSYGVLKTERIPGCLLYGPPGNGKTLLAKAIAKESGAQMLEISAASINDRYLGQSEKNVRAIFSLARKMAPMVIFLDEADALLSRRGGQHRNAHREVITQFLREWDGMSDMRAFIIVATNRPFDLDEAVLRRLPRRILVDLPLPAEREAILRVILRDEILMPDVDLAALARQLDLYSGSDLKNLCVAAAMEAVKAEQAAKAQHTGPEKFEYPVRRTLTLAHFSAAADEISASISEDMESLKAVRKFDTQYGDKGRKAKRKGGMGFGVGTTKEGTETARVREVSLD